MPSNAAAAASIMSDFSSRNQKVEGATTGRDEAARRRVSAVLRERGVAPTSQRVSIALEMLLEPTHLTAEEVVRRVGRQDAHVSRATVYNTLRCFVDHGLLRLVNVGTERVFYDSNTSAHHHFYDPQSGRLTDIDDSEVSIVGMPRLPEGHEVEAVELVIRLKPAS